MANTYDTSAFPLGSKDPRVLYNNASNFDDAVNALIATWVDRFGRDRKTWYGFEQDFNQFLINSGYEPVHLIYTDGQPLQVDRPTQLIDRAGITYRIKMPATFPVTLSGTWATDVPLLVDIADASLRQDLALPGGINLVSGGDFSGARVTPPLFSGYGPRTLGDRAGDFLRLDTVASLTPNDPTVDNGPVLNAILAIAAQNRIPVDGYGATFYVRTPVIFNSYSYVKRCVFESMGAPSGDTAAKAHIPVVSAVGTRMYFEDVHVDGHRELWPNISMSTPGPEGGGSEDGGMHAWRVPGAVTDSVWVRCSGNNSGTAGWALHNPTPSTSASTFVKRNLKFYDCDGIGNREHGMFGDSFDGIEWIGGKLTGNGLDLNTTDPLTSGTRGARSGGLLFGAAFDLEAYGPNFLGSMFTDFTIQGVDCTGNAIMPLIYNPIASSVAGYVPFRNLKVLDCTTDKGLAADADRLAATIGLAFRIYSNADGADTVVSPQIRITQNDGHGEFIGVTDLDHSAGYVGGTALKARLVSPRGTFDVSCAGRTNNLQILLPEPVPTFTVVSGTVTVTPTARGVVAAPNSSMDLIYDITFAAGTGTPGVLVTAPAGYRIGPGSSISLTTSSGVPSPSTLLLNPIGTANIWLGAPASSGSLVLRLVPNN